MIESFALIALGVDRIVSLRVFVCSVDLDMWEYLSYGIGTRKKVGIKSNSKVDSADVFRLYCDKISDHLVAVWCLEAAARRNHQAPLIFVPPSAAFGPYYLASKFVKALACWV